MSTPALLSGTAGSGKSTILVYYLLRPELRAGRRLFLTYSPFLQRFSERIYRGLVKNTELEPPASGAREPLPSAPETGHQSQRLSLGGREAEVLRAGPGFPRGAPAQPYVAVTRARSLLVLYDGPEPSELWEADPLRELLGLKNDGEALNLLLEGGEVKNLERSLASRRQ